MRKSETILTLFGVLFILLPTQWSDAQPSSSRSCPIIVDHASTGLGNIPDEWIEFVKTNLRMYYVHASHGGQLTIGLQIIEDADSKYGVVIGDGSLPNELGSFNVYDRPGDPFHFWQYLCWSPGDCVDGKAMTRQVLNSNPSINIAIFSWCTNMNTATESYVLDYLNAMEELEAEFPNVTFVYMTGTADVWWADDNSDGIYDGLNRHLRNEEIRQYCRNNNKVLFDFEDLDSWWLNPETNQWEHSTFTSGGYTFSIPSPAFVTDNSCGHMNNEACIQKGRAVWWMLARVAGWDPSEPLVTLTSPNGGEEISSGMNFTIRWIAPSRAGSFTLKFSEDNGATWNMIADSLTGNSHDWSVPAPKNVNPKCYVKVIGRDGSGAQVVGKDKSDSPFTIKTVKLTFPDAGVVLRSGDPLTIGWTIFETRKPITKVKLFYTKNGGRTWNPIGSFPVGSYPPGDYNHSLTVPSVKTLKNRCKLKVVLLDTKNVNRGSDTSDSYFTIEP